MDYYPPRNTVPTDADPRPEYFNGEPTAGIKGAIPPALALEHPQREILKVIEEAGLLPSDADTTQLWQAIKILINQLIEARLAVVDDGGGGTIGDPDYVEPEDGNVQLLATMGAGDREINLGREDPNRWIVFVEADFSANAFGSDLSAPTVDGVAASTAVSRRNGLADDGHRAAIFYKHVPAGETVDISVPNGARVHVYRMVGVSPGSTPVAAVYNDGDGVTLTHPVSGKGAVFVAAVQNFADTPLYGIDGCLAALTAPNVSTHTSTIVGANRVLPASNAYKVSHHSSPIFLTVGVVFEYDI